MHRRARQDSGPGSLVLLTILGFGLLAIAPQAGAGRAERYYLDVVNGEAAEGVPAMLVDKAKAALTVERGKRAELVPDLKGAPDAKADPKAFRKWLENRHLKAYAVTVKLTAYRKVVKDHPQGKGKVLEVHVAVALMGDNVPDGTMGLAGQGSGTVMLEIGPKPRPKDEEVATDDALNHAVGRALDDAVSKLRAAKAAK